MNDENDEQAASAENEAPATVRLAVFEQTGVGKSHLATITLSKGEGSTWTLQAAGSSDPAIERLRPLLEGFSQKRQALTDDATARQAISPADALADVLMAQGFTVETLPAGDHQISFQIDLNDGLVVGTHAPMHPLAASDDGMGRRVFEAITSGFSKASDELADEIDKHNENNNPKEAVLAIEREADRGFFTLRPNERLLNSLQRIDISGLQAADKRLVRDCRLIVAQRLDRHDVAGPEAGAILSEDGATLEPQQKAALKMAIALGTLRKGHRETALSMLRDLIKEPSDLNADSRGWAWRNISLSLSADDPEARLAAKLSADAFLEAGKKEEAGKSMMRLANILMGQDPAEAVKALDEMIAILEKEGLRDRFVRGAALHARANRLAKLNRHQEAFRDACTAVELQRGLLGAETQFVSSLHLAALEACYVGETDKADALEAEAEKLTDELQIPHFLLAKRVRALGQAFDPAEAEELLREAETSQNLEVIAAVRIFQATKDPSLTDTQRLELLEQTHSRITGSRGDKPMLQPVRFAIGKQLAQIGELQRAIQWFRRILASDPLDRHAGGELINCLWKTEKWGEAAIFLRGVLDLVGDKPGILFAYGKSLFESSDM